ncbi:hypothetical protein BDF19DRAFT_311426 [Syncephalis fuscata]|nr:hypothetical protein BDF19DRAFT_311426 [Syncephalis fuscata]
MDSQYPAVFSSFLELIRTSITSMVEHINTRNDVDRTHELRLLSGLVSRLIPTRIIRFSSNLNDPSLSRVLSQRHGQLYNHCMLILTLADATLSIIDRPFADLLFQFLPPDTTDIAAKRICLDQCSQLVHIYYRHERVPIDVLAVLSHQLQLPITTIIHHQQL